MTEKRQEFILADVKRRQTPSDIAKGLRLHDNEEAPTITMEDIYNQKKKIRREALGLFTSIQSLLKYLQEANWYVEYQTNGITQEITHMFFARPSSIQFLKTCWEVFLMDCTYKTNKYKLPLLVICGITSLGTTFYIAFAFPRQEKEVDCFRDCEGALSCRTIFVLPIVTNKANDGK